MKVTFILANIHGAYLDSMYTGVQRVPEKRTTTIELTEEQIKKIGIKEVGRNCERTMYEDITDCFIEKEV